MGNTHRNKTKSAGRGRKSAADMLTLAYVGAFGLIALLTYIGHSITANIMDVQRQTAEVSYYLGQQRSLVQQISFHASNYYRHNEEFDLALLTTSFEQLKKSKQYLEYSMSKPVFLRQVFGGDVQSEALEKVYYNPPYYLDKQLDAFIDFTGQFINFDDKDNEDQRSKLHTYVSREYSDKILPALDAALANYQQESIERMEQYFQIQFYVTVFIMIVLVLEAYFIFRPLVNSIKKYHTMLFRHANEDELTGLDNRRAFTVKAKEAMAEACEKGEDLTFVLMDLDKFKSVNDTYGHDVGDRVLQHFSKLLKNKLRPEDIVGRVGGEEFALILTNMNEQAARKTLERLRSFVEKTPCRYKDSQGKYCGLDYTSSMGYISIPSGSRYSLETLIKAADEALYESKENGRNCVSRGRLPMKAETESEVSEAVAVAVSKA